MLDNIDELYQKMSEIGLDGWISNEEGECLRKHIEAVPEGGRYMEIGVAFGKSLATMAVFAKPKVELWGIDVLNWSQRDENFEKLGIESGRVNFIEGDSQQEALGWGVKEPKPIDLLFIDGDHTYYGVMKDLLSWLPHVKADGTILLHDYDKTSPGVMRAIHNFIYPHRAYYDFDQEGSIYYFKKR